SRRRHTRFSRDWSSDVCSSDLSTACSNSSERPRSAKFISIVMSGSSGVSRWYGAGRDEPSANAAPYAPGGEKVNLTSDSVPRRDEPAELRDLTTCPGARLQAVSPFAQAAILPFDIEAGVEVFGAAGPVQRGAENTLVAHEQQQPALMRADCGNHVDRDAVAQPHFFEAAGSLAELGERALRTLARARGDADDHPLLEPNLACYLGLPAIREQSQWFLGSDREAVRSRRLFWRSVDRLVGRYRPVRQRRRKGRQKERKRGKQRDDTIHPGGT